MKKMGSSSLEEEKEEKTVNKAFVQANETFDRYCDFLVYRGWMEKEKGEDAKRYYKTVREEEPLKGYRQVVFDELCERYRCQ